MDFKIGGIVGSVKIVTASRSYWFSGDYGFVLKNARRTRFRPMKGKLGFFDVRPKVGQADQQTVKTRPMEKAACRRLTSDRRLVMSHREIDFCPPLFFGANSPFKLQFLNLFRYESPCEFVGVSEQT